MSDPKDNAAMTTGTSAHSFASPRRTSLTSQALADLLGPNRNRPSFGSTDHPLNGTVGSFPGSVASAAAAHRRVSLSGIGMTAPNGGLGGFRRTASVSSHNSGAIDESAVETGEPLSAQGSPGNNSFGRRMSFGARALRDVRTAGSPSASSANDSGYKWADSFRNRAERSASIASQNMATGSGPSPTHERSKSVTSLQRPPTQQPKEPRPLDHMQERILKGDFYMD